MELQLFVFVEVTLDEKQARLVIRGHLTETNQHLLYSLIHRARTPASRTQVIIDLTTLPHFEPAALDLLRWEMELNQPEHLTQPVRFALLNPPRPATHPPPPRTRRNRQCATHAWESR
ncbi:hypothetical protein [Kocuria sp. CPCC 205263]|uniref:hypothetical protein n=1 Tax=Kocuria sp. CPCC 205263 TaxID=3073555 RepID=UPI0034D684A5